MARPPVGPPRGLLEHARSDGSHLRIAPADDLASYVAHFWWVAWDLPEPKQVETLPHPTAHLVFEGERAELHGVPTTRFVRRLQGRGHVLGIKLRPAALAPLVEAPVSALCDRALPLSRVLGRDATSWSRAMLAATDIHAAIAIAEPFLRARLPPMPARVARLRDLVERMERDRGLTRVQDVATLAHVTPRTLERVFRALVGVSPKWVLKRYRLHEAAARLTAKNPPALARIARELGYFDQAHFTRDFKAVVGRPPSEIRTRQPPHSMPR